MKKHTREKQAQEMLAAVRDFVQSLEAQGRLKDAEELRSRRGISA